MIKHLLFLFIVFILVTSVASQEIKQFRVEDFDLKGNVKTCQVITDYGQEIFEFDILGRLVRGTTQYNESDKDVTSYRFVKTELVEKRVESYKGNRLDPSSSMAYFYNIDTTGNKRIKVQVISYDRAFVEVQEHLYDGNGRLERITISHENAVDEIVIERTTHMNENTKTYFENGVVQRSIQESTGKDQRFGEVKITLTKTYLDGEPNKAIDEIMDDKGFLVAKEVLQYHRGQKGFVSMENRTFEYDDEGILKKEIIYRGNATSIKEYIFQLDDNQERNWVKKIVTPENTFITRKITYYPKSITGPREP